MTQYPLQPLPTITKTKDLIQSYFFKRIIIIFKVNLVVIFVIPHQMSLTEHIEISFNKYSSMSSVLSYQRDNVDQTVSVRGGNPGHVSGRDIPSLL